MASSSPRIHARHLLRAPAGDGTATVAGLYFTGTYPQKTGGSDDRLNAAHTKREERKHHRRVCGKTKRHLPGLLLPLPPVQSPMQTSYASGVAKDRHESAPSRVADRWPGGHAAMNHKPFSGKLPLVASAWRCRVTLG